MCVYTFNFSAITKQVMAFSPCNVTSLLLLTSVKCSRHLTHSTNHKRRYIKNRDILKKLRSSGNEHKGQISSS